MNKIFEYLPNSLMQVTTAKFFFYISFLLFLMPVCARSRYYCQHHLISYSFSLSCENSLEIVLDYLWPVWTFLLPLKRQPEPDGALTCINQPNTLERRCFCRSLSGKVFSWPSQTFPLGENRNMLWPPWAYLIIHRWAAHSSPFRILIMEDRK